MQNFMLSVPTGVTATLVELLATEDLDPGVLSRQDLFNTVETIIKAGEAASKLIYGEKI